MRSGCLISSLPSSALTPVNACTREARVARGRQGAWATGREGCSEPLEWLARLGWRNKLLVLVLARCRDEIRIVRACRRAGEGTSSSSSSSTHHALASFETRPCPALPRANSSQPSRALELLKLKPPAIRRHLGRDGPLVHSRCSRVEDMTFTQNIHLIFRCRLPMSVRCEEKGRKRMPPPPPPPAPPPAAAAAAPPPPSFLLPPH